jgi:hypothetical protein
MPWTNGAAGTLWSANFKINSTERGFNLKFWFANSSEAAAKTGANDLAARIKLLMPVDCEIFYATVNNDNGVRDSRFLKDALGAGAYVTPGGGSPPPTKTDFSRTSFLFRMEHTEGGSVTRKFSCIPDEVVSAGALTVALPSVTTLPVGSVPAPGAADWVTEFLNFMKALGNNTQAVQSGHTPGGAYKYAQWSSIFGLRIGDKKGGRLFSS